jgi:hypothetical protein
VDHRPGLYAASFLLEDRLRGPDVVCREMLRPAGGLERRRYEGKCLGTRAFRPISELLGSTSSARCLIGVLSGAWTSPIADY